MKQTAMLKDRIRELTQNKTRFLSIFLMIALGSMVYVGIRASGVIMRETLEDYTQASLMADLEIASPLGLETEDRLLIDRIQGKKKVQYVFQSDHTLKGDPSTVFRVQSITPDISQFQVEEGRLPQHQGQGVFDLALKAQGAKIGDQVILAGLDEDDPLIEHTFTITGFARSLDFMSPDNRGRSTIGDGSVDHFIGVLESNFDPEVKDPVLVRLLFTELEGLNTQSENYQSQIKSIQEDVESLFAVRPNQRKIKLKNEANAEIEDAEKKIQDAEKQIEDGRKELRDARKELDEGYQDYYDGQKEFKDGIAKGEKKLRDAKAKLDQGLKDLKANQKSYDQGVQDLNTGIAEGQKKLNESKSELEKARADLDQGRKDYEAGLVEFESALAAGQKDLDDAKAQLDHAKLELDKGRTKLETQKQAANQEIARQKDDLNQQERKLQAQKNELQSQQAMLVAQKAQLETQVAQSQDPMAIVALKSQIGQIDMQLAQVQGGLQQIEGGLAQINAGYAQIQAAQAQIDAEFLPHEQKLASAQSQYEKGLADWQAGLETFNQQVSDQRKPLDDAKAQLDQGEADYQEGLTLYQEGVRKLENEKISGQRKLVEGKQKLDDGWKAYKEGLASYEKGVRELKNERAKGQRELDKAYQELMDGEAEYRDGIATFEDESKTAEEDIAQAKLDIADAKEVIAKLKIPNYSIEARNDRYDYYFFYESSNNLDMLAAVIPPFLYAIGLLVSLTTMTRMVDERRMQIGTLKMLGYSNGAIALKYLVYGGLAGVLGSVLGAILGEKILTPVIFDAYAMDLELPTPSMRPHWDHILASVSLGLVFTVLATALALKSTLDNKPANLLRPKAPKSGNRILLESIKPLWKRMSFFAKVTARNIFRYKGRALMTIFGVAGCTGLIFFGFNLRDSISALPHYQMDKIQHYDLIAYENSGAKEADLSHFEEEIMSNPAFSLVTKVHFDSGTIRDKKGLKQDLSLIVPQDPDQFKKVLCLVDRQTQAKLDYPKDGAIVSEKLAQILDLQAGDKLAISDSYGIRYDIPVYKVFENYIGHYVLMTPEAYEQIFDKPAEFNAYYTIFSEGGKKDHESVRTKLLKEEAIAHVSSVSTIQDTMDNLVKSLDLVVYIILGASGLLAVVVLYSLTNINVSERMRELTTIKVLGFHPGEVTAYVYRETFSLTLIGILLGFAIGDWLHKYIINELPPANVMFVQEASPWNLLIAALYTLAMNLIVMIIMHRRLKSIDMVEALKINE